MTRRVENPTMERQERVIRENEEQVLEGGTNEFGVLVIAVNCWQKGGVLQFDESAILQATVALNGTGQLPGVLTVPFITCYPVLLRHYKASVWCSIKQIDLPK